MNEILFIGYHAKHSEDFVYHYPELTDFYLLLLITSPAEIYLDNKWVSVSSGTAILYAPGQEIHYRACGQPYSNDWIRLLSDEAFVTRFPLHGVPFSVSDPEYCHNLIKLLTWETSFSSGNSELIISNLLHALFLKLKEDSADTLQNPHSSSILQLRKKVYHNPGKDWNVPDMARELHVSTGYLQTRYKQIFGVSCMDDVIECRLRLAKDQLIYTDKTTTQISEFCGYHNVEHFCRQFKKLNGCTPLQYRTEHSQQSKSQNPEHTTVTGSILKKESSKDFS